jgi:hypothetical protein
LGRPSIFPLLVQLCSNICKGDGADVPFQCAVVGGAELALAAKPRDQDSLRRYIKGTASLSRRLQRVQDLKENRVKGASRNVDISICE